MAEFGPVPLSILFVIILYVLIGEYFKSIHFHLIHETSFGILVGMLIGLLVKLTDSVAYAKFFELNTSLFFYLILPLIIFSGGYNLKKKKFLQNFKYITSFGFISTLLNYLITLALTIAINAMGIYLKTNYFFLIKQGLVRLGTSIHQSLPLTYGQIMLYSATICATDSVAALTLISSDTYPKLFSVVFGEGMVNDAVSIIMFQAVNQLQDPNSPMQFRWYTPLELIGRFLENCVLSLLIGLTIGLFSTWCFKRFRFLTLSTTVETVFAFLMAYLGYSICEMLQLSGVISLLMIGIMMSHYQGYNISQLGKVTTRVTFESMSLTAEAFIYVYLGFAVWDQTTYFNPITGDLYFVEISWVFTLTQIFVVMIARYLSIYIVYWISVAVQGKAQWKLTSSELAVCCFAGFVRGSVAFALIQTLQANPTNGIEINQINIIQSSVLFTVVGTTLVFGTAMPFFVSYQLKSQQQEEKAERLLLLEDKEKNSPKDNKENKEIKKLSEAQIIIKYLDENYFKRWFIYDYENRKNDINKQKKQIKNETLQEIYEKAFSEISEDDFRSQKGEDFTSPILQKDLINNKEQIVLKETIKMQEMSQQI